MMFPSLSGIFFYLAATALLGTRLRYPAFAEKGAIRIGSMGAMAFGAILHGMALFQVIPAGGGLDPGVANIVSLLAWCIVLVLLFGAMVRPLIDLGIVILPLASLAIALALLYPGAHGPSENMAPGNMILGAEIHMVTSILATSVLATAAFQSLFLAFQERSLRRKRPSRALRVLPPLQVQESILFQLIGIGFFLLGLGLASGMAFIEDMFAQHLAHKTILSLLAWVMFGALLWGRWRFGWRGRLAVRWSLVGFAALMLAYFGSKLVLETVLGRAWY